MVERNLKTARSRAVKRRTDQRDWFVRGPIPWPWIRAAMALRGSGLHVAMQLLLWSGMKKSRVVRLNMSAMPVGRSAVSRGLGYLERAGLVRVRRQRGRWPVVTILIPLAENF